MSRKYELGYEHGWDDASMVAAEDAEQNILDAYDDGWNDCMTSQETAPARWEEVTVDLKGAGHTYRLAVPGGWLYRTVSYRYPDLHALYEEDIDEDGCLSDDWSVEEIHMGQEIAVQTTLFVPDAA